LSARALWQPPVLAGGPVSRDISGSPHIVRRSCQQRHLWQPSYCGAVLSAETSLATPILYGGPVSRDVSGSPHTVRQSCQQGRLWQPPYCTVVLSAGTSLAAPSTGWFSGDDELTFVQVTRAHLRLKRGFVSQSPMFGSN
jgi:hypothetical protein